MAMREPAFTAAVRRSCAGAVRQGEVAVDELVGAELLDGLAQRRLLLAEALGLSAVMLSECQQIWQEDGRRSIVSHASS